MLESRERFDRLAESVDEHEDLANRLETEIIEWNASKKLIKRDEELEALGLLLNDIAYECDEEIQEVEVEFAKQ